MSTLSVNDVENNMLDVLRRVEAGETFVVVRDKKPVAEIKPILPAVSSALRPHGLCAGEFRVPDDFNQPLPESLLNDFEGT
jgi:antitoxin (DNA-binding transcriptional repressor) of toxin-antitoxin stability system